MRIQSLLVSALLIGLSITASGRTVKPELSQKRLSGEYTAQVAFVNDGDTFDAYIGSDFFRIRLSDIDAPEVNHCTPKSLSDCKLKGQPLGRESGEHLRQLVSGRTVSLVCKKYDAKLQRNVCRVYVDGRDVNFDLVERGLAWYSKQYSNDAQLNQAFEQAQRKRRGLWRAGLGGEPIAPWDWRNFCWKQGRCPHAE